MKQCFYKICMILAAILLSVSCVDSDIIDNGEEGQQKPGGTGDNISFKLSIPFPKQMTKGYIQENAGSLGESLIEGVRIVLYSESTKTVAYVWDMDIQTEYSDATKVLEATGDDVAEWGYRESTLVIHTKARRAGMGDYYMLIIANPTEAIRRITGVGNVLSAVTNGEFDPTVEGSMYRTASNIRGVTDGEAVYFLMLNAQGPIRIYENNFYDTQENAEEHPVDGLGIERVAAKISTAYTGPTEVTNTNIGRFMIQLDSSSGTDWGDDYDIPDEMAGTLICPICGGTINRVTKSCPVCDYQYGNGEGIGATVTAVRYIVATDFTWQVDITNKKSYWNRHLTYKANGEMEEQNDEDRENFYAEDPNFEVVDRDELTDEFTYISNNIFNATARKLAPFSSYPYADYWSWENADTQPVYVPENTMEQADQKYDVTTRLIVKAILRRENITVGDDKTLTDSYQIGDFFVFKGGITENYIGYNTDKENRNYYILLAEDVVKYAKGTATPPYNYGQVMEDGNVISVSLANAITAFKTANPDFNWDNLGNNTKPAYSDNLLYYKNGEMFYEVPIEHFDADEAGGAGKYGRFGVVRNNWYQLDIQTVTSLGAPTIPPPVEAIIENEIVN